MWNKIKEVRFEPGDNYFISQLNTDTIEDIKYGVITPDGIVVKCDFGCHSIAYCIAITLYMIKNHPELLSNKDEDLIEYISVNLKDGVLINPYDFQFTTWGLAARLKEYQENYP